MANMVNDTELGLNRTGVATSPELCSEMLEGTTEFLPSSPGDALEIARVREEYSKDAEPLGSVPPPVNFKGAVKTAAKAVLGKHPTLFIDKLGERLSFERSGVRLYQALIAKHDAFGSFDDGPSRDDLERVMLDEYRHFQLLAEAVKKVGGDPTVMTPSADFHATVTKGVMDAVLDPRTTFAQCLEAILVVELADNACWDALTEMAQAIGEDALAEQFQAALAAEQEHLDRVQLWVAAAQARDHLAAE